MEAGIEIISPEQCAPLATSILNKTKTSLAEITLKRLFRFTEAKFNPSFFTLNTLSIYCGYQNWGEFCRLHPISSSTDNNQHAGVFNDPLVSALLETSIPTVILKADAPDFTIVTYNKAYQDATNSHKRELTELSLWEAYNPEKAGGYGPTLLLEAFHEAIFKQRQVHMKPLHYNIPSAIPAITELSWWDIKIVPVIYDGTVKYLLLNTYNITDKVLHEDAIEHAIMKELTMAEDLATANIKLNIAIENIAQNHRELTVAKTQLEEANKNLEKHVFDRTIKLFESEAVQRKLIDNAPVAIGILKGPNHVVETANKKLVEYWGKGNTVIDKPLAEAIPELEGQPFISILDEVRRSGIAYINPELRALLNIDDVIQPRYFDMIYQPMQHSPGITDSIFIVAFDITEHVNSRKSLERSESMLRLAADAANIGIWSFDPKEKTLSYNTKFAQILGWDKETAMTYDEGVGQVTEEFREQIVRVIDKAIFNKEVYDFSYAHKRFNDGKVIWLRSTGKVMTDSSDGHHVFSGIIREIPGKDGTL